MSISRLSTPHPILRKWYKARIGCFMKSNTAAFEHMICFIKGTIRLINWNDWLRHINNNRSDKQIRCQASPASSKSPELGISQDILKIKQIYLPVAGFHQILTPPVQIFTRLPLVPNGMLTAYKSHSVLSSHFSTCMLVQGFVRLMQLERKAARRTKSQSWDHIRINC